MTTPKDELVPVEQRHRDAAAGLIEAQYAAQGARLGALETPTEIRNGHRDWCAEVQYFARLASLRTAEADEALVEKVAEAIYMSEPADDDEGQALSWKQCTELYPEQCGSVRAGARAALSIIEPAIRAKVLDAERQRAEQAEKKLAEALDAIQLVADVNIRTQQTKIAKDFLASLNATEQSDKGGEG